MEKIESIKILHVEGLHGTTSGGTGSNEGGLPDQIVNSALKFRTQGPLLDSLLEEIGIKGGLSKVQDAAKLS